MARICQLVLCASAALRCYCIALAALLLFVTGCGRTRPGTSSSAPQALRRASRATAEIGYVGDATCVECHDEMAGHYQAHSMGRSLAVVPETNRSTVEEIPAISFEADGFRYAVDVVAGQLIHRQGRLTPDGAEVAVIEQPVEYVVGSGNHGQSFLIDRDGYLFMSPITHYPARGIWALSPGFEKNNSQFNRPIAEICLFCHSNRALRHDHTLNHYGPPAFDGYTIGCERCHGPGQHHVERRRAGTVEVADDTIVNPSRLEPALREAVCQQCHLSGVARVLKPGRSLYDYRPGAPLDSCFSIFVMRSPTSTGERFVGQVEQMYQSRCFQASDGQLGCISCHDPHRLPAPEERAEFYRARCLDCHTIESCAVEQTQRRLTTAEDSCILCHMPQQETEVRHASTTDHRIPRFADHQATPEPAVKATELPIVRFPPRNGELSSQRDLAIALVRVSGSHPEHVKTYHLERVLPPLERTTGQDLDDLEAFESLGEIYLSLGQPGKAIEAYEHVLQRQPKRESSLAILADVLHRLEQYDRAIGYWKRAIQVNPWISRYWYGLGQAYAGTEQWPLCRQTAEQARQRFPTSIGARHLLVESNLRLGDAAAAEAEFQQIRRFHPPGFDALEAWYNAHPLRLPTR